MNIRILLILAAALGIGLGYSGASPTEQAAARAATMPAAPHIVYLSAADAVHGQMTAQTAQRLGATLQPSWAAVQQAAQVQPLDALLVARDQFAGLSDADRSWLRRQIEDGVVIVGIGIDIEPFSAALGLPSLRDPGEAPAPIGEDGYILFQALLLGAPEDVQAMRDANWLERSILGENVQLETKNLLNGEWGRSRGKFATAQDVEVFRNDLFGWIENAYKNRAEFQRLLVEEQSQ
jgi:hypothetical protein